MRSNKYIQFFFGAVILTLIVSFSACRKEKEAVIPVDSGSKFIFNVSNHIGSANIDKISKSQVSNPNSLFSMKNNVNVISEAQEVIINKDLISTRNILDKKISSSSPIHTYTRYRLLLYNLTKERLEKNIEAEAGKNLEVAVTPGDEYKWYAYSYNTQGSIDTPIMENNVPVIKTVADKEFLWASASSPITATNQTIPLSIIFDHKVAEIILEIDIKELHGSITDLNIEFEEPNYFNTADINLFTGDPSNIQDYSTPELTLENFEYDASTDSTVLRAKFYTAVPLNKIENLKVNIKKITALHNNNKINNLHKLEDPAKEIQFTFNNPHLSKSHIASMKFRYAIPTKRILHVIGHYENNDDLNWAFAAQPYERNLTGWTYSATTNGAPLNMIKEPKNFGTLNESVVYTAGFSHVRSVDDQLAQKLTAVGEIPDIVIIAVYYRLTEDDIVALTNYINNGGVVIMMTDAIMAVNRNNLAEVNSTQSFFQSFFGNNAISLVYPNLAQGGYETSSMFLLDHNETINDRIINGPFGNLRGKFWGVDTAPVIQAQGLPVGNGPQEVTVYSDPKAINMPGQSVGISMFKHNSKNFFWIGDGSFLSHPNKQQSGYSNGWNAEPFATVNYPSQPNINNPQLNYTHYPLPKRYGQDYNSPILGNVGYNHGSQVYNAPLFANLIAWAVYQAEFFGLKKN